MDYFQLNWIRLDDFSIIKNSSKYKQNKIAEIVAFMISQIIPKIMKIKKNPIKLRKTNTENKAKNQ